jgi:hypothetical protein
MGRTFGLVSLVCSLTIVSILWAFSARQTGPTSDTAQQAKSDAIEAVSQIGFQAAATALEGYHAQNGTFVGATLPPAYSVTVVRADALSYCLQAEIAGAVQHFNGPGGAPEAGPC